jgi:hypothetical protein
MIVCPNCNKDPLYLSVSQTIVFTLKDVGFQDVIPDERIDENGEKALECLGCGWRGWTSDYHQAKNGLIKLFCKTEEGVPL